MPFEIRKKLRLWSHKWELVSPAAT